MLKQRLLHLKNNSWGRASIAICIVLVVVFILIFWRVQAQSRLRAETNEDAIPVVSILTTTPGPGSEKIILPGNVEPWHEATIYARTNGYIKKWYVDIGSHVKAGSLLAEIESPEIDAQLQQAEADLNTAIANESLAQSTAKRWVALLKSDAVSRQETDEKVSLAKALSATVISARANRNRLRELVSFERVIAPFDGVITSRTTDIGALINAGSGTTAVPLFHIVQANPLRVYVQIPQNYSSNIKPDMGVSLYFAEHPGKSYPAKLLKTANAINRVTRTLLAQFEVDNSDGALLPGGFTQVHLEMPISKKLIHLPVNVLLFRAKGLQVAVLDNQNRVVLKSVTVSRDYGNDVEVDTGLSVGERVILNPPDSIFDGEEVHIAEPKDSLSAEKP